MKLHVKSNLLRRGFIVAVPMLAVIIGVFAATRGANSAFVARQSAIMTQQVNGIEVEVKSIGRSGSSAELEICYPLLNNVRDIMVRNLVIQVDGKLIPTFVQTLSTVVYADNRTISYEALSGSSVAQKQFNQEAPAKRCDVVSFTDASVTTAKQVNLLIGGIGLSGIPERLDCANTKAKVIAKNAALQIDCINSDGMSGATVTSLPAGMSKAEGDRLLIEAITDYVVGPWQFAVPFSS